MAKGQFLTELIRQMLAKNASDLHLKVGSIPTVRVKGSLEKLDLEPMTDEMMQRLIDSTLNEYQKETLTTKKSVDFAFNLEAFGRFRGHFFYQMGSISFVVRIIEMNVPDFEALNIPNVFEKIATEMRGLILVAGATSAGKSTTVASLVNYINHFRNCHIVTVEDPIEYIHTEDRAIINQREIGEDVESFREALRYVVRQDPDVIVIGEMRDAESFQSAIAASETGHLVISTVHANNTAQCFERILGFFPSDQHEQLLTQLSFNIKAISCQRLIRKKDGSGVVPAFEIMVYTPAIAKLLRENRLPKIGQAIQGGAKDGMQTFNQALLQLCKEGSIDKEEALLASDNPQALEMNLKGIFLTDDDGGILGSE